MKLAYRNQKNAEAVAQYWNKPLDKPDWYSVKNLDAGEAELFIYDYVGWPYNDAGELVRMLSDIKDTPVLARINSPGGDVWDGMAILNAFTNHPGGVRVRIESLAASIASVLAMGGKTVEAYSNTMMMIHNSWVFTAGNRKELIELADLLEQIDENLLGAYVSKTKLGKREVRDMMDTETWMNAKKMKEKGFIDTILEAGKPAKAQFDLSMFANIPDDINEGTGNLNNELTVRDAEKTLRPTEREIEHALRNMGVSQSRAKAMISLSKDQPDTNEAKLAIKQMIASLEG